MCLKKIRARLADLGDRVVEGARQVRDQYNAMKGFFDLLRASWPDADRHPAPAKDKPSRQP